MGIPEIMEQPRGWGEGMHYHKEEWDLVAGVKRDLFFFGKSSRSLSS